MDTDVKQWIFYSGLVAGGNTSVHCSFCVSSNSEVRQSDLPDTLVTKASPAEVPAKRSRQETNPHHREVAGGLVRRRRVMPLLGWHRLLCGGFLRQQRC